MGSQVILLLCLIPIFTSAFPMTLPNKTELALGWKFSRAHPYHYFQSVQEIPHNYLPIQVSSLPDRQGVWVLRHKEFEGGPKFFSEDHDEKLENKAVIKFDTKVQFFGNFTIKMLVYGDIEFNVKFPGNKEQTLSILEKDKLEKCTGSGKEGPPKWMTFKIQTPPTTKVKKLKIKLSFIIIIS